MLSFPAIQAMQRDVSALGSHVEVKMFSAATRFVMAIGITTAAALSSATAEPSARPEAGGNVSALNSVFWSEYKAVNDSADFTALKKAAGPTDKVNAAIAEGRKTSRQSIVNVAVDRPAEVAKLLTGIAASPTGSANQTAVATVLAMRTTAKARAAAAPFVAPAAKAQVVAMTANLSTGITGLPGIYLGDNAAANGGTRAATPTGYSRVAGGSMGCRPR
jgi:hypothetical protein